MIKIAVLDAEMNAIMAAHPQLVKYYQAVDDEHVSRKLHDAVGMNFVVALPTYGGLGQSDTPNEQHAIMIWVVEKPGVDYTDQDERDQYARMQDQIVSIKEYIRESQEDGCSLWWKLDIDSIVIEPEYNIWGGFNGWFMQLTF
tara:strand:+ start:21343 stop:21771 length:429 start_codon:yes stop_codon:yes gene_type:complete